MTFPSSREVSFKSGSQGIWNRGKGQILPNLFQRCSGSNTVYRAKKFTTLSNKLRVRSSEFDYRELTISEQIKKSG